MKEARKKLMLLLLADAMTLSLAACCREKGISEAICCRRKKEYGGMHPSEAKRLADEEEITANCQTGQRLWSVRFAVDIFCASEYNIK